jgi:hypothetical protein
VPAFLSDSRRLGRSRRRAQGPQGPLESFDLVPREPVQGGALVRLGGREQRGYLRAPPLGFEDQRAPEVGRVRAALD